MLDVMNKTAALRRLLQSEGGTLHEYYSTKQPTGIRRLSLILISGRSPWTVRPGQANVRRQG